MGILIQHSEFKKIPSAMAGFFVIFANMKRLLGCLSILVVLAGCGNPSPVATRHAMSLPAELVAIDSLMQTQPDSALTMLLDSPMDDHYYQLLLSEALYKNDSAQLNRSELLQAMAYYDSVDNAFLAARCHYMNGVGYYEMDSVVPACAAYLKALEIMENHFKEEELVGHKAKLMALTYTHLCGLFSDQYLHEQAIYFGKHSLPYYQQYEAEPWHVAWILNEIGSHYHMIEKLDSADYYYKKAIDYLSDSCNQTYRDLATVRALLCYNKVNNAQVSLEQLHLLLVQAESQNEYLSRCAVIGEIFYREQQFDSARFYLDKVFDESLNIASKKQAAEWLVEICKIQETNFIKYTDYLVPFANIEESKSELKSQLAELYSILIQNRQKRLYQNRSWYQIQWLMIIIVGLIVVLSTVFLCINRNKKLHHKAQIEEERRINEIKQKAIRGRLRESNEALRSQIKENEELRQVLTTQQQQKDWDNLEIFIKESICQEILTMLNGVVIKRDAKSDDYPELRLNPYQLSRLRVAVEQHFNGFSQMLTNLYPRISHDEMSQCLLCLLDLKDVQIAALLHCDYSTIKKRSAKMKKALGIDTKLQHYIRHFVL